MGFNNNFKKNINQGNNREQKPEKVFPNGYLEGGYFEDKDKKILKCEYIVEYPKHIVKNFKEGDKNKSSQLRKYYDFVVRIKDALKYDIKEYEEVKTEINKLDYYSKYAETRGKVTSYFVSFIEKNLRAINSKEDFLAFATHFEAIIAYLPKDR